MRLRRRADHHLAPRSISRARNPGLSRVYPLHRLASQGSGRHRAPFAQRRSGSLRSISRAPRACALSGGALDLALAPTPRRLDRATAPRSRKGAPGRCARSHAPNIATATPASRAYEARSQAGCSMDAPQILPGRSPDATQGLPGRSWYATGAAAE